MLSGIWAIGENHRITLFLARLPIGYHLFIFLRRQPKIHQKITILNYTHLFNKLHMAMS
jgi:hypothetical protein